MNEQYCRIGAITPVADGSLGADWLEIQYRFFMEKAAEAAQAESGLRDFFERKAAQFQRMLQNLV